MLSSAHPVPVEQVVEAVAELADQDERPHRGGRVGQREGHPALGRDAAKRASSSASGGTAPTKSNCDAHEEAAGLAVAVLLAGRGCWRRRCTRNPATACTRPGPVGAGEREHVLRAGRAGWHGGAPGSAAVRGRADGDAAAYNGAPRARSTRTAGGDAPLPRLAGMSPLDQPAAEPSTRWLDAEERAAWLSLSRTIVKLPSALDAQLERDADLNYFEYLVMAMLSEQETRTLRMSQLAALSNASLSRLSHVAKRLENAGVPAPRARPRRRPLHPGHADPGGLRQGRRLGARARERGPRDGLRRPHRHPAAPAPRGHRRHPDPRRPGQQQLAHPAAGLTA